MTKEIKDELRKGIAHKALMIEGGNGEIIIREGDALPAREPVPLKIDGCIDSPLRYIRKRKDLINHPAANIRVDRDAMCINLEVGENSFYKDTVTGRLKKSTELDAFGINSGEYISNFDMADLVKKNRSYFESKTVAMKLVSELRNFKAKVERELELSDDKRGNANVRKSQIVESNLPESFHINVPVFKGMEARRIEVEVEINPTDLSCTLVSPEANDILTEERDSIINGQIGLIEEEAPDILIVEV